jgi:hypothetical protein
MCPRHGPPPADPAVGGHHAVPGALPGRGAAASLRLPAVETADLHDLQAEHFEPGQQAVQGGLIGQLTVYHRLHRFYGGDEVLEIKQGLRWEDSQDADLVRGGCHRAPSQSER